MSVCVRLCGMDTKLSYRPAPRNRQIERNFNLDREKGHFARDDDDTRKLEILKKSLQKTLEKALKIEILCTPELLAFGGSAMPSTKKA